MLALALCFGCGGGSRPHGRVLLVGIDGASPRVAFSLLREGKLPNLARIAEEGIFGPLRSHIPLTSPRVWTSIATGKSPRKHGILSFARKGADGEQRLYQSSDRKVPALWNIVTDAGMSVAVVNWWTTYPLEKVRGVIVSDHLLPRELQGRRNLTGARAVEAGPIVYPEAWGDRVQALSKATGPLTDVADPFADRAAFPEWAFPDRLSERYRNDEWLTRIALEVERELHPDVLMLLLPGIDRVSHRLWGALEPESKYPNPPFTPEQREFAADALLRYYEYSDALIGTLLERYGPDDLVMVVSDHGFEAGVGLLFLTGQHKTPEALHGVIFARGPDIAPPERGRPVSVNDVTPTILAWLGLPVGDDMDGKPASFLAIDAAEIAHIPSYHAGPIERLGAGRSGAEETMLENLKSLGYMEEDDHP
jgi:predicted AlkP superfamily phosphohydrolase/phosphomutase